MNYYNTCPDCGAHLDPGERCDCCDENTDDSDEQDEKPNRLTQTD